MNQIDSMLDTVGLSEADVERISLGTENVSPEDRKKLKGIIARLAKKAHPFTTCMADLRKHHPEWSDDRRKKTCAVLKQLTGRGNEKKTSMGEAIDIDEGVAALLSHVDLSEVTC